MYFAAETLIALIIGTQRVAMHDQHAMTVRIQHLLFRQQLHAAGAGIAFAEQEIAVTVNKIDRQRQGAQRGGHLGM